ncbi:MAG: septal ring lytic transglycosylase RlpA family protein [Cyanobacteria bacterium J06554_11]
MFLLSSDSLKQQFANGLTIAVFLSGAAASAASAQSPSPSVETKVGDFNEVVSTPEQRASEPFSEPKSSQGSDEAAVDALQSISEISPELSDNIMVYPHEIDGRQAATLYVKDIPVLTFIGTEIHTLSNRNDAISLATADTTAELQSGSATAGDILNEAAENDPVLRANSLGRQLADEQVDASALSVRWHEETDGYIVTLADEDLIALDSRTVLADTTEDAAEDALQVTNRLRRLLGGADPISEIEGLPEPEPVVEVAPAQTVAIVSSNVGGASWYGPGFHGRTSANGEIFNQYALTAAHRTLPFGTRVLVTNLYNGRQVTVRINDRGPYAGNRIIDLSAAAAAEIGMIDSGVGTVQIDVLAY